MPRIRSIKPEFWKSEVVGRCSILARLTFIGMWNFADDDGRGRGSDSYLYGEIHAYSKAGTRRRFKSALKELEESNLVEFYKDDRGCAYYWIKGFNSHQKIDHPKPSRLPPPPSFAILRENPRLEQGAGSREQGAGSREGNWGDAPLSPTLVVLKDALGRKDKDRETFKDEPTVDEIFLRRMIKLAQKGAKMTNKLDTLRTVLSSMIARYGGADVEAWLMDSENIGKNTNEMQDSMRQKSTDARLGKSPF